MSLTIEFAGISTLVWNKQKNEAEVLLVDLGAAGYQRHHAMLAMADNPCVIAPQPDASIAVPGQPLELGIWDLKGTDIEIDAKDAGPLEVVADEVNSAEPPAAGAESIRWLPNISELCQSKSLNTKCPIAARIRIRSGRITATAANFPQTRVQYFDGDRTLGSVTYTLSRFMLEIPSTDVRVRLDGQRVIEVHTDHQAMISNTCAYESAFEGMSGHFYAHYLTVAARRHPVVQGMRSTRRAAFAAFAWPQNPEYCVPAFVEI